MRLPLITSLVLVMLIASATHAQKFSHGYYIKASGDTVRDEIFLQRKKESIDKVVTPEGLFLAPKDLLGMGLDGINYIVGTVSVDKSPNDGVVTDTVFLEVMNRGKISLLFMIDENDKAHFYIQNEFGLHELSVRLKDPGNGVPLQRLDVYKGTLKGLFPTCTDLFTAIDKTVLSRKGIQNIYEKLYTCRYNEAPPALKEQNDYATTDFGVTIGVSSTDLHFPSNNTGSFAPFFDFKKSTDPTGGLFLETTFSRKQNFSLRNELIYRKYSVSDQYQENQFTPNIYVATVDMSYIRYAMNVRWYIGHSSIRPFVNAGVAPAYAISSSQTLERRGGITPGVTPLFKSVSKFDLGLVAGIGVKYKSFALDFKYETSAGPKPKDNEAGSKVKTLYFMLSYKLM